MKAITIHQPWASLIALGVKTIETRSWKPAASAIGQPLAIHAGKKMVRFPENYGLIGSYVTGDWTDNVQHAPRCDCDCDEEQLGNRCAKASGASPALFDGTVSAAFNFPLVTTCPLGAIVATCRLVDVVPIIGYDRSRNLNFDGKGNDLWPHSPADYVVDTKGDRLGSLRRIARESHSTYGHRITNLESQRPYGDFTPGRFAWLLDDIAPCDPIPTKGRQGLWEAK